MDIDVIIEISKNSNIKYEYDVFNKNFRVDRILYGSNVYPTNYGFINETLDFDGDPLDVLVLSDHAFLPGTIVPVRIIGGFDMIDDGEVDTKLIGVIKCDPRFSNINKLQDVDEHKINEILNFFKTYKVLQKKSVDVQSTFSTEKAIKIYEETKHLYEKFESQIKSGKSDEIKKELKRLYPDKFTK